MLEEIYLKRREEIDNAIKKAIKEVQGNLIEIDLTKIEKDVYDALEENYNLKLASISKELYLQGFKDGINLMQEIK